MKYFFKIALSFILFGAVQRNAGVAQPWAQAVNDIYNTNTGNVGIGNTAPTEKLHITGGLRIERNLGSVSNQNNSLRIIISSSLFNTTPLAAGTINFTSANTNPGSTPDMAFSANGTTHQLVLKNNGLLAIGTTTPSSPRNYRLQVHGGGILVSGTNGQGGPMICFGDDVSANAYPNGRWGIEYEPNAKGLNFWQPWNPATGGGGNYFLLLKNDGKIGMGINPDDKNGTVFAGNYKLFVNGGILTTNIKVANYASSEWADFVFDSAYRLMPLAEVEKFIGANKHLPDIPSAADIEKNGLELPQMQSRQMQKIEELTLYIIQMQKEIDRLKQAVNRLQNR